MYKFKLGGHRERRARRILLPRSPRRGRLGDVCRDDKAANDRDLKERGRLVSAYTTLSGLKILVITEWDRSVTTILLPSEY